MVYWLLKEEPSHYSYDDLVKEGRTNWDGVRNPLAQKNLRSVKKGDEAIFYHTRDVKAAIGIVKVISDPYPDPSSKSGKLVAIDVEPLKKLARPVKLAEIKEKELFKDFALVKIPRLSVMHVPKELWNEILNMSTN